MATVANDDGSLKRVPQIKGCKPCYVWFQKHVSYNTTFDEHCQRLAQDDSYKQRCDEAKQIEDGSRSRTFQAQEVVRSEDFEVVLERSFEVMTMNDMRRATGLEFIPARFLKSHSTMIPKEGSEGDEQAWLFLDEERPNRRLIVRSKLSSSCSQTVLDKSQHVFREQGQGFHNQTIKTVKETMGLDKVSVPHLGSAKEWLARVAKTTANPGQPDRLGASGDSESAISHVAPGAVMSLSGVAMHGRSPMPVTPTVTKRHADSLDSGDRTQRSISSFLRGGVSPSPSPSPEAVRASQVDKQTSFDAESFDADGDSGILTLFL